jgi:hypothetical protein
VEDRESIHRLNGELVVFFNATAKLVDAWRSGDDQIPRDLPVLADETATVYDDLGTIRRQTPLGLVPGSIGALFGAAAKGRLPKLTSADMLRLGADVAVRADGEIATLHRARTPDDRVALVELLGALEA